MNKDGIFPHVFLIQVAVYKFYQEETVHFFVDAGITQHPINFFDH